MASDNLREEALCLIWDHNETDYHQLRIPSYTLVVLKRTVWKRPWRGFT